MLSLRGTVERIKHKHDSFYKCVCFVCDTQCVTHKWRQETFLRVCVVGERRKGGVGGCFPTIGGCSFALVGV